MHQGFRIGKAERATPYEPSAPGLTPTDQMPTDLQREAVGRLALAALVYTLTYVAAYFGPVLFHLLKHHETPEWFGGFRTLMSLDAIAMALLVGWLARSRRLSAARTLDIGLVFMVLGAFGIAMPTMYGALPDYESYVAAQQRYMGIPWECVWIIVFPLIAPNCHRKTLVAALLSASMGPLAVIISTARGATSPDIPFSFWLKWYLFSTYLCALLAMFIARLINTYGQRVRQAREIGRYRLTEPLGHGGMGEVWKAEHTMLARPAAIKLIRPEALGESATGGAALMRRFEREALATARLKSVHTISIYDFGITDQGAFYYVMELLDGLDLASLVKRFGPVPASRAVRILRQCCHSLGEAHACSLVHRDIKPANIFLCRLGPDHDFVKILDFGLVKTDSGAGAGDLTQKGVTFGTPDFMAPEMAVGRDGVDGRADIYSLGCVAYWLLTGQRVFGDGSAMQVVVDHVKTDPPPPSSRTELPIPLELDAIVLSCLAKDPASRPQTAGELARRLAGVPAGRDWDESRAAAWWNLHVPAPTDDETPATPTPASAAD